MQHSEKVPASPWFENWFNTPFYHVLYKHRDIQEAKNFIDKLASFLNFHAGVRVLDVACGNGRHAQIIQACGAQVWGIDLATESIHEARKSRDSSIFFEVHDMRKPFKPGFFDVVCNLFTSFGYFETDEENVKCLKAMVENIKPGGSFVLDYLNPEVVCSRLVPFETKQEGDLTFSIERKVVNGRIVKSIEVIHDQKRATFYESVTLYTPAQIQKILKEAGLTDIQMFGDYDLNVYDSAHSPRMIVIAKRTY